MPRALLTPDRLLDRTWRPHRPFAVRVGPFRRAVMAVLLILFTVVIAAYWVVTDAERVRRVSEQSLSGLLGGRVKVGHADLSIFEGLRLDNVRVLGDAPGPDGKDEVVFSAKTFLVRHNPRALLAGTLEPTEIVAIEPLVNLVENTDTHQWNIQSLIPKPAKPAPKPTGPLPSLRTAPRELQLPRILLRNARMQYSQLAAGRLTEIGSMNLEGQLQQGLNNDDYLFKLQSRGDNAGLGAAIEGKLIRSTRQVTASLQNFQFNADIRTLLPVQVRTWWEQHGLRGKVDIPEFVFKPSDDPLKSEFRITVDLKNVNLTIRPEEWMGSDEIRSLAWTRESIEVMRYSGVASGSAGGGFADKLVELIEPKPVELQNVSGRVVFTDTGRIDVEGIRGHIENNGLKITGFYDGYSGSSPAHVRISSLDTEDIIVPAAPRYVNSMPPAVREIYDRLRPQGRCSFWIELDRPTAGARPEVSGEVRIIDGNFVFDRFSYPVSHATGRLIFGKNSSTGREQLEIRGLRGRGIEGGPNADAIVEVNGLVSPFGSETGVTLRVTASNVQSEPALFTAFPGTVRTALRVLDAPGHDEYPKFRGSFEVNVVRPVGLNRHWTIDTDVHLDDAAGELVFFPYPISGVSGTLRVRDDYVDIVNLRTDRNGSQLNVDGRVDWSRARFNPMGVIGPFNSNSLIMPPPRYYPIRKSGVRTDLKITARNVPVDDALIKALHPSRSKWLRDAGVTGRLDIDGVVEPNKAGDTTFSFGVTLRDGTMLPIDGKPTLTDATGKFKVGSQRLVIEQVTARRGDATVRADGEVAWHDDGASVVMSAAAENLALDAALYKSLPKPAQQGWDQMAPKGTVDASLKYSGGTGPPGFELVVTPRHLSVVPLPVPFQLDDVKGTLTVRPDVVKMENVTARHGDASIHLTATGQPNDRGSWEFAFGGRGVVIDDAFRKSLPPAVLQTMQSLQLQGTLDFDFTKMSVSPPTMKPARGEPVPDVSFAVDFTLHNGSMNVGVAATSVEGSGKLSGSNRGGRLADFGGEIKMDSAKLSGRAIKNVSAKLAKRAELPLLQLSDLQGDIAGGTLAGRLDLAFPDDAPSRYATELVLRDADIKTLTGELDEDIRGRMTASLQLEGNYDNAATRRGRGDVRLEGQRMMRIPVVLGLLQITSLALPISRPFTEGTASYTVDGPRLAFESLELRNADMVMQGSGQLDFDKKQVRMSFVTDNAGWKIPIIGDLLEGARHELLQVHVRGTLQDPKVSATSFGTVRSTIDEVLKGDDKPTTTGKK